MLLWAIAAILMILWMLGLVAGYTTGLFIHSLCAIAVLLLLISIIREVKIYRELGHMVRSRNYKSANSKNLSQ